MGSLLGGLGTVLAPVVTPIVTVVTPPPTTTPTPTPAPTTPPAGPKSVAIGTPLAKWALTAGETVYVNNRVGPNPQPWSPFTVAYVWPDGNAVLVNPQQRVFMTAGMWVGHHLRRASETYPDGYPGP